MKIGLDIHGVIDTEPELFSKLSNGCIKKGWQVHIITGQEDTKILRDTLKEYGIAYSHIFSIISYHKKLGTVITHDEKGNPWMDEDIWNRTKGGYCLKKGIDIHIDDSYTYGKYFETTYIKLVKAIDGTLYFLPIVFKFMNEVIKLWQKVPREKI